MPIKVANIINGITNTRWPCRLEKVTKGKLIDILPAGSVLYIDGAHNAAGAKVIANFLKTQKDHDTLHNYIINGRTKDTDSISFLKQFIGIAKKVIAVRVKMEPLAESPYIIAKCAQEVGLKSCVASSLTEAIEIAIQDNTQDSNSFIIKPIRVCICGSFYLARDLKIENSIK